MNAGELAAKLAAHPEAIICVDFVKECEGSQADDSFDLLSVTLYKNPSSSAKYITLHLGTAKMRVGATPYTRNLSSNEETL